MELSPAPSASGSIRWEEASDGGTPKKSRTGGKLSNRAIVVGSGVSAYLTAAALDKRGFSVTLLSNSAPPSVDRKTEARVPEARYACLGAAATQALNNFPGLAPSLNDARKQTQLSDIIEIFSDKSVKSVGANILASKPFAAIAADATCSSYAERTSRVMRLSGPTAVDSVTLSEDGWIQVSVGTPTGRTSFRTRLLVAADGDGPSSILSHVRQKGMDNVCASREDLDLNGVCSDSKGDLVPTLSNNHECVLRRTVQISGSEANRYSSPSAAVVFRSNRKNKEFRNFDLYMYPSFSESSDRVGCIHAREDHEIWKTKTVEAMYKLFERNFPAMKCRKLISYSCMWNFVECPAKPVPSPKCIGTPAVLVGQTNNATSDEGDDGDMSVGGIIFIGRSARALPPDAPGSLDSALQDAAAVADAFDVVCSDAETHGDGQMVAGLVKEFNNRRQKELRALIDVVSRMEPLRGDSGDLQGRSENNVTSVVSRRVAKVVGRTKIGASISRQFDLNHMLLTMPSFVDVMRCRRGAHRRAVGASIAIPTIAAGVILKLFVRTSRRLLPGPGSDSDSDSDD